MGREIRRVPTDFDHPIGEIWPGFLMPRELALPECRHCGGEGLSPYGMHLQSLWYGNKPFRPEDNGSTPHTTSTPAVRAFAERNILRAPEFYGRGESAIIREAQRLADLWNGMWMSHLNADDVAALVDGGDLRNLTHTHTDAGWVPKDPAPTLTPGQVNQFMIETFGCGGSTCLTAMRARAAREGKNIECDTCGGWGNVATPEQRAAHNAWQSTPPPEGDGWQMWSTTTEGHPMSPVFPTGQELATWMSQNPCGFGGATVSLAAAMTMVSGDGWAPSMVADAHGVRDGITTMGDAQ